MDLVVASIPSIDSNEPIIKIIPTNCSVVKVDKNGEFIYMGIPTCKIVKNPMRFINKMEFFSNFQNRIFLFFASCSEFLIY